MLNLLYTTLLVFSLLAGPSTGAFSAPRTQATPQPKLETQALETPQPFHLEMNIEQHFDFHQTTDPFTQFYFDAHYAFNPKHRLRLVQPARLRTTLKPNVATSLSFDDLNFFYYYRVMKDLYSIEVNFRTGVTFPISTRSRENGNISRPNFQFEFTRSFFNNKLKASYRPYFQYNMNRFTHTPEGAPLRLIALGHMFIFDYTLYPNIVIGVLLNGAIHWQYTSVQKRDPTLITDRTFEWETYMGYTFSPHLTVRLGYADGEDFSKDGTYNMYALDPEYSLFYVALDLRY